MLFKASAPGSLMLMGEHAVLHGKLALVCAVNKRITVTLKPRLDRQINIVSALGHYAGEISQLQIVAPFQFVLTVLKTFQKKMSVGCDITIESEFSDQIGFGSSAAVTVATLSALSLWLHLNFSSIDLIKQARRMIRAVQGLGSGADAAACVLGGVLAYRARPFFIEKLTDRFPLTVCYSGSKTPTVDVIQHVNQLFLSSPSLFKQICVAIERCVFAGKQAINQQNWNELGKMMNINQGFMDALGVSNSVLNDIVYTLRQQPTILGSKISGSGLGDCVIGLGKIDMPGSLMVEISGKGVTCEQA